MKRKSEKRFPIRILIAFLVLIVLIGGGMEFYHQVEGWDRLDSAYFSVITFTTIGFGDFTPSNSVSKVFTMIFSFVGIAVAFHLFVLIGSYVFEKKLASEEKRIKQKVKYEEEQKEKESTKKKSKKKSKKRGSRKTNL